MRKAPPSPRRQQSLPRIIGISFVPSNTLIHITGKGYLQHFILKSYASISYLAFVCNKIYLKVPLYNLGGLHVSIKMAAPTYIPCRQPIGPLGFLNYPPEIMNCIYQHLLVDHDQVLVFLCSINMNLRRVNLKRCVCKLNQPKGQVEWSHLFDSRFYVDSTGLSAQFLRVCKRFWLEGSPVLYGNLNIAMRPSKRPDPCLAEHFPQNLPYILAWANKITLQIDLPSAIRYAGWTG